MRIIGDDQTLLGALSGVAVHIAFGLVAYWYFYGAPDFADWWLYVVVLLWPVLFFFYLVKWSFIVLLCIAMGTFALLWTFVLLAWVVGEINKIFKAQNS